MFIATVNLQSISAISFSKKISTPKNDNETHEQHEERTWKERCHINGNNTVMIPANFITSAMHNAAKMLNRKIPGKGNSTYTKHFLAGVRALNGIDTYIKLSNVEREDLSVSSDGTVGGRKRVDKTFPVIRDWKGEVQFLVTDDTIDHTIFEDALTTAGILIGLGRFRPMNRGDKGMFKVNNIKFKDLKDISDTVKYISKSNKRPSRKKKK